MTNCCNNQTRCTCGSGPTRYNGPNIDCIGLTAGTPYDEVVQLLAESFCDIEFEDGVGISSTVDNGDGTVTFLYTNGTSITINTSTGTPVIVEGDDDIVVTSYVNPSGVLTYTVSRPKQFLYEETVSAVDISVDPDFVSLVYFQPTGYTNLSYTNTTLTAKTYKVHASYEFTVGDVTPNNSEFKSWVDAAIVKNTTPVYEVSGQLNVSAYLYWGPNSTDLIGTGSPAHLLLDDQGSEVDVRFASGQVPLNSSFFKVVTLNPGESVSMQFRTKDVTAPGQPALALLRKAQFMVDEV
jgi:hypothetical protein